MYHHVTGDVTLESITSEKCHISGVMVWVDIDTATFRLFDKNNTALFPSAVADRIGLFAFPKNKKGEPEIVNGLKITTTNFTGGSLSVFYEMVG